MEKKKKDLSSVFQVTVSFLVLYVATMVVIFIPDLDHDLIRFSLLSSLFVISFLFQFYILNYKTKSEKVNRNRLKCLLGEQDKTARMLIRRDRALTNANKRLREIDKLKSEFISVAAHQMRTPLSGIKWSLDMLVKETFGPVNVKQKRLLMKSHESNERMILLVNDLLKIDRLESGRSKFEFVRVNLKDIVDNVLYYVNPQAERKNIRINLSAEDMLPFVNVDTEKMREVVQNIIENAVKYSKEEGDIDINIYTENENVVLSVKDNGIGIPEDFRDNVFTKFYRGGNAVKIKTEGNGLGLYVSKEIVKKHDGDISFESKEGVGTVFYVRIPVADNFKE